MIVDKVATFQQLVAGHAPARGCSVGRLLAGLDVDLRSAVEAALGDMAVQHSRIAAALREVDALLDGRALTQQTIGRHRRGECGCEK